ncbi:MAG: phosphate acyltransferase PlsX [Alphaproteobacteria bacterium]|nr:phosphate acyltransferase PlsX [Alphaproteobacteria bacterium]MBT5389231.1 phosphate acyltransferase PlsX [Alphaproteobacteria bacterium]MBT5540598.1 phosphate acyltransferase PlsX [Alphaproteobacteria bacterium]MBT5654011.1 phosphate acyltransferase PlsX [Alphaproteobacteria bacterium]
MKKTLTLALDGMGGVSGPETVLEAANLAIERYPHVQFIVFGDQDELRAQLEKWPKLKDHCEIHHTAISVPDDMKPSVALRTARQSSMHLAVEAVKARKADGVVSAGNTGAYMAFSKIFLKTIPGINRPAISTHVPTLKNEIVLLDLGANLECDAENLVQFALMGATYATHVMGIKKPRIGLLNVGEEELKGPPSLQEAASILKSAHSLVNFHGFVEGDDIAKGTVDVIVTDGFTGNVALKTLEGTARLVRSYIRGAFESSFFAKIGCFFATPALKAVRERTNPSKYNGAIFIGLNGVAVKSHGSADAQGFSNAISVAIDMVSHGFNSHIEKDLKTLDALRAQIETPAQKVQAI